MTLRTILSRRYRTELDALLLAWKRSRKVVPDYVHTSLRDALDEWMVSNVPNTIVMPQLPFHTMSIPDAITAAHDEVLKTVLDIPPVPWTPTLEVAVSTARSNLQNGAVSRLVAFDASIAPLLVHPMWRMATTFDDISLGAPCGTGTLVEYDASRFPDVRKRGELAWDMLRTEPLAAWKSVKARIPSSPYTLTLLPGRIHISDTHKSHEIAVDASHEYMTVHNAPCGATLITTGARGGVSDTMAIRCTNGEFVAAELSEDDETEAFAAVETRSRGEGIDFRDHGNVLCLKLSSAGACVVCENTLVFKSVEVMAAALGSPQSWFAVYFTGRVDLMCGASVVESRVFENVGSAYI